MKSMWAFPELGRTQLQACRLQFLTESMCLWDVCLLSSHPIFNDARRCGEKSSNISAMSLSLPQQVMSLWQVYSLAAITTVIRRGYVGIRTLSRRSRTLTCLVISHQKRIAIL